MALSFPVMMRRGRDLGRWFCLLSCWITGVSAETAVPPARKGPDWLASAVVYEVFPRAFSQEGSLAGVTRRLGELRELGVNVIWLMPIHPTGEKLKPGPEGSPYAVRDYYAVDARLGTREDLLELVEKAHGLGMKVILDLVPNHTAWDAEWMKKDLDVYRKDSEGRILHPQPEWKDVAALDYSKPETRQAMIEVMQFWLREANVDGFRCDAACFVPVEFWEEAREALDRTHPDILLLAEAEEPHFLVRAFDIDYDWPLYFSLNRVMLEGKSAKDLRETWEKSRAKFPAGSRHLRFSDNHDQVRAVVRYGLGGAMAAQVLIFTLDGVPLVYNGMEVGDATESTAPALFQNRKIEWDPVGRPGLRDLYRELIAFRKKNPALTSGELVWLDNAEESSVLSFLRKGAGEELLVVINLSSRPLGVAPRGVDLKNYEQVQFPKNAGQAEKKQDRVELPGFGWVILKKHAGEG